MPESQQDAATPSTTAAPPPLDDVTVQAPAKGGTQIPAEQLRQLPTDDVKNVPIDEVKQSPASDVKQTPADESRHVPSDDDAKHAPANDATQTPADDNEQQTPAEEEGNTNNNNLRHCRPCLPIYVQDVNKSFTARAKSAPAQRRRPQSAQQQLRKQLGTWGDVMKPQSNLHDLNICGKSTTTTMEVASDVTTVAIYRQRSSPPSSSPSGVGRLARPSSAAAAGPRNFRLEEKRRLIARAARPSSAGATHHSGEHQHYLTLESRGATMFQRRCQDAPAAAAAQARAAGALPLSRTAMLQPADVTAAASLQRRWNMVAPRDSSVR